MEKCVCQPVIYPRGCFDNYFMRLNAEGFYMKRHPVSLKLNIAYGLANGYTQREIGASLGVHQSTISRHARRPDVVAMIRAEEKRVGREWEEYIHCAAKDPQVKAEAERVCMKLLMDHLSRVARSRRYA